MTQTGDGDGELDDGESGYGDLGDGESDYGDPGDGDGDPPPPPPDLQLELCEPLEFTATQVFTPTYPYTYAVGDVDGQPGDEVVIYQSSEIVSIGAGVPTHSPHPGPGGGAIDAVILQADGEGMPDLLVAGNSLHAFVGDGGGAFEYVGSRDFDVHQLGKAISPMGDALLADEYVFIDALADVPFVHPGDVRPQSGDFDGDGVDELAFKPYDEDGVQIWAREADTYVYSATLDCALEGFEPGSAEIGDVNADGLDDVSCVAGTIDDVIAISLWTSLGGLEFSRQSTVGLPGKNYGWGQLMVVDLEGDGAPETLYDGRFMRLGEDGNFACYQYLDLIITNKPFCAGDLDADGRHELIHVDLDDVLWVYSVP